MGTTRKRKGLRRGGAFHLSKSANWGSPRPIVDLGRGVLGEIDFDAASSGAWNMVIGARHFYDGSKGRNLIAGDAPPKGTRTAFCNSPGDDTGELVRSFWMRLVDLWIHREIDSLFWVGFSLEQMVSLQKLSDGSRSPYPSPLSSCAATLIGRRRWRYLRMVDGVAVEGDKPTHGSYATLLPSHDPAERRQQLGVMRAMGQRIGELIIRPHNDSDVSEPPAIGPGLVEASVARVLSERRGKRAA
jgi:hypothetical protein